MVKMERLDEALASVDLFYRRGLPISRDIAHSLLQCCTKKNDVAAGRQVHALMVNSGLDSVSILGDHLVRLFASCGSLLEANQVFCKVAKPNVYTWQAIIAAHAALGESKRALMLYAKMQQDGISPDKVTFLCVLKACGSIGDIQRGRLTHRQIVISGLASDVAVGNTLIDMYGRCSSLEEAHKVFDNILNRSVVSWNAIMAIYAQHGLGCTVLDLYDKMQQDGIIGDRVTLLSLLRACSCIGAIDQGKLVHEQIMRTGFASDKVMGNALIDMYAKCGRLERAREVFDSLSARDTVSWSTLIAGCVQNGYDIPALELFSEMQQEGVRPDKVTFLSMSKACASLVQGKLLHVEVVTSGLESDVLVGNSLIDMYAKCGSLEMARLVFNNLPYQNAVTWNSIIAAYAQHGHGFSALEHFAKMQYEGLKPDKVTLLCILKACASVRARDHGKIIHDHVIRDGLELDDLIGNSLVDLYAKCGNLEEAQFLFEKLPSRNEVSWSALIAGYALHGHGYIALELFQKMRMEGFEPGKYMLLSVLKICGSLGALEQAKLLHAQAVRIGVELDVMVGSTIVDVYAKCGSLGDAHKVFVRLPNPEVVTWNAMIAGYAQHGHGLLALGLYRKLQEEGLKPNKVTFLSILKACAGVGALEEGKLTHDKLRRSGLQLDTIVKNSLLDMYAKCGSLNDAKEVFKEMPNPDVVSWNAMIAGYAQHNYGLCALELFEKMQEQDICPNRVTFLCILKACASTGAIGQGKLIHDKLIRSGLQADIVVGNTLIDMYAKCGLLHEAHAMFEALPNHDLVSWSAMIAGYAEHGNYSLAGKFLKDMQQRNLKPVGRIYTSILAACVHAGQVEEGHQHFKSMEEKHCITPAVEHFNCIVDLLGRAGRLKEAEQLLLTMPTTPDVASWTSLLTACKTYSNLEIGRQCFDEVVQLDPKIAGCYMLMSNIYADAHRWKDVHHMQHHRKLSCAWKKPGLAWIEIDSRQHEFIASKKVHLETDAVSFKLFRLDMHIKEEGYMPQLDLVVDPIASDD